MKSQTKNLKMLPMSPSLDEKRRYEEAFNERAAHCYSLHAGPVPDGTTRWRNPPSRLGRSGRSRVMPKETILTFLQEANDEK